MTNSTTRRPEGKTIWIDLENSPHVPFFAPIIDELRKRHYTVLLTGRDCFQVKDLVKLFQLDCQISGRHFGKNRVMKLAGLCLRALQLAPTVLRAAPDLAVAHVSRSQLIVTSALRIPTLFISDYEFATTSAGIHPTWLMYPELIPTDAFTKGPSRLLKYPGIKEDVYVPRFVPKPGIREQLGVGEQELLVTVRPPATEAHYYRPESTQLFEAFVEVASQRSDVTLVVLPRNGRQDTWLRQRWPALFSSGKMRIPATLDGLNLMWFSDLVVSGGGTMNREAAALGVPVYSVFRGEIGAVDQYLSKTGRLVLIEAVEDLHRKMKFVRRDRPTTPEAGAATTLDSIVSQLVSIVESRSPTLGHTATVPVEHSVRTL